jgi:O-succinylhomoserine sulfhydrylase
LKPACFCGRFFLFEGDDHMSKSWRAATQLVHGGTTRSQHGENRGSHLPHRRASSYDTVGGGRSPLRRATDPGFIYSPVYGNPTNGVDLREAHDRLLEGAEAARATASGMAAVTAAILCQLKAGDHVVAARALFGSCRYVVEDARCRATACRIHARRRPRPRPSGEKAVRPEEHEGVLPRKPDQPDARGLSTSPASRRSPTRSALKVVVDNVFATPLFSRSRWKLGAHVVVYSATKHIDGQGRCLGGMVLLRQGMDRRDHLHDYFRHTGPSAVAVQRLDAAEGVLRRCRCASSSRRRSAAAIADFLAAHPKRSPRHLSRPQRPPAGRSSSKRQMTGGSTLICLRRRRAARKRPSAATHWR